MTTIATRASRARGTVVRPIAARARWAAALSVAMLVLAFVAAATPAVAGERLEKVEELEGVLASGGRLVMSESSSAIRVRIGMSPASRGA